MVSTKRKKKRARAATALATTAPPRPPSTKEDTQEEEDDDQEVLLDAAGEEILAMGQALGDIAIDAPDGVTAALARQLAPRGIELRWAPGKGRVCRAAGGFEPGRVLLEEGAYVFGAGASWVVLACVLLDNDGAIDDGVRALMMYGLTWHTTACTHTHRHPRLRRRPPLPRMRQRPRQRW